MGNTNIKSIEKYNKKAVRKHGNRTRQHGSQKKKTWKQIIWKIQTQINRKTQKWTRKTDSENTQPEKESVSTNKEHFQPGVFAAVLFPTKKGKSVTVCIGQILDIDDQEFQLKYMKKSGKTYIWPDKQDISWETDDKLVATVAEPTMSDKRSHFVFDSEELEDISKKLSKDYRYVYFC